MGPEAVEFCGGTHLERTGQAGAFVITGESSIAAGTRRIEALVGEPAVRWLQAMRARQDRVSRALAIRPDDLETRLTAMQEEIKQLRRELGELREEKAAKRARGLSAREAFGYSVIAQKMDVSDPAELRSAIDAARQGRKKTIVQLGATIDDRVYLATGVTNDCLPAIHAGKLLSEVARIVGGKGGGRPDLAQGGGGDPAKLDEALAHVPEIVKSMLG
jgi:alanyl-tRNA synthetase